MPRAILSNSENPSRAFVSPPSDDMAQWKITQTIRAANKHLYLHEYLTDCSKRRVSWHPLLMIFKASEVSRKSVCGVKSSGGVCVWQVGLFFSAANKHLYLHEYLTECSKRRVSWHPILMIFKASEVSRKSVCGVKSSGGVCVWQVGLSYSVSLW
jgi:hypothetical protein